MTRQTQADVMKLADMVRGQVPDERVMRYVEAYLMMALRAGYRPGAADGMGNIQLSDDKHNDVVRLLRESFEYAVRFDKEDDTREFHIGCSNFPTNRAFLFSIEAAHLLAAGSDFEPLAIKLLQMAIEEIRDAGRQRKAQAA